MWSNPWIVGIIGGIISGLFVFFVTNFLVNKVSKKEYFNQVNQANQELVSLLIVSVSEGELPSLTILQSLASSISRKYNVKQQDVNTVKDTLEDLIREIFDTNFISVENKIEVSEKLEKRVMEYERNKQVNEEESTSSNVFNIGISRNLTSFFVVLTTAATMTTFITVLEGATASIVMPNNLSMLVGIGTSIGVGTYILVYFYTKRKKEMEREKQVNNFKNYINKNTINRIIK